MNHLAAILTCLIDVEWNRARHHAGPDTWVGPRATEVSCGLDVIHRLVLDAIDVCMRHESALV